MTSDDLNPGQPPNSFSEHQGILHKATSFFRGLLRRPSSRQHDNSANGAKVRVGPIPPQTQSACEPNATSDLPNSPDIGHMWAGVARNGQGIELSDVEPSIEAFDLKAWSAFDCGMHATWAVKFWRHNYDAIGRFGFYVVNAVGATVVCKLHPEVLEQIAIDKDFSLTFNTFRMPTFPIVRGVLQLRRRDGMVQTMENLLNIEWADVQDFFESLVRRGRCIIHIVVDREYPKYHWENSIAVPYGAEACDSFRDDVVLEAVKCYLEIPVNLRNFPRAVEAYHAQNPL
jgi:hypothetical protein